MKKYDLVVTFKGTNAHITALTTVIANSLGEAKTIAFKKYKDKNIDFIKELR